MGRGAPPPRQGPGGPPGEDRGRKMARRLRIQAEGRSVPAEGVDQLLAAYELAMEPRRRNLEEDHDFRYLHPGRTVLILLEDVGLTDAGPLAAAALAESMDPELQVPTERVEEELGAEVARLRDWIPVPRGRGAGGKGPSLLEEFLAAPEPLQKGALAERLDQLRHLHIRARDQRQESGRGSGPAGEPPWGRVAREAREVYLPLAHRVDPVLHRRYAWWCRKVGAQFE